MRVLTLGTFDLFHRGHVALLARCRALAGPSGAVIVGLNTDRFVAAYKRPPTLGYDDREAVLAACRYVDAVLPNDQPDGTIRDVLVPADPDVVAVGWDWHPSSGRDYWEQIGLTRAQLAERDIAVAWLPRTEGISSSAILARRP